MIGVGLSLTLSRGGTGGEPTPRLRGIRSGSNAGALTLASVSGHTLTGIRSGSSVGTLSGFLSSGALTGIRSGSSVGTLTLASVSGHTLTGIRSGSVIGALAGAPAQAAPTVIGAGIPDQTKTTADTTTVLDLTSYFEVAGDSPALDSITLIAVSGDGVFETGVFETGVFIEGDVPSGVTADLAALTVTLDWSTIGVYSGDISVRVTNAGGSATSSFTMTVTADTDNLLLETGDALLLETGDLLLTE